MTPTEPTIEGDDIKQPVHQKPPARPPRKIDNAATLERARRLNHEGNGHRYHRLPAEEEHAWRWFFGLSGAAFLIALVWTLWPR